MTPETMRHALSVKGDAEKLLQQYNGWVLLKLDAGSVKEIINVGDPIMYKNGSYHREQIPISDTGRRYIFKLWKHEIGMKYNACVRELNQIGMLHDLKLLPLERPYP